MLQKRPEIPAVKAKFRSFVREKAVISDRLPCPINRYDGKASWSRCLIWVHVENKFPNFLVIKGFLWKFILPGGRVRGLSIGDAGEMHCLPSRWGEAGHLGHSLGSGYL